MKSNSLFIRRVTSSIEFSHCALLDWGSTGCGRARLRRKRGERTSRHCWVTAKFTWLLVSPGSCTLTTMSSQLAVPAVLPPIYNTSVSYLPCANCLFGIEGQDFEERWVMKELEERGRRLFIVIFQQFAVRTDVLLTSRSRYRDLSQWLP